MGVKDNFIYEECIKELDAMFENNNTHDPNTTEDDWENEGGMALPHIDDNSSREELDNWKEGYKK
jgi:hypothetical protein|tara:strand:+ start:572 stop:766 length:195 start_codon:yes stop_codon:yes gene_type:complete